MVSQRDIAPIALECVRLQERIGQMEKATADQAAECGRKLAAMQAALSERDAQISRLQGEGTAGLLKHREEKAVLKKAIDLLCADLSARSDVYGQLSERDRRIGELEGAIRIRTIDGCDCQSCEELRAALAGKGVSRG